MNNELQVIEKKLLSTYKSKGFLTEDEVTDICIDNNLDLIEIDAMCERLLSKRLIIREEAGRTYIDDVVDRSQFDYESLYISIHKEYPECDVLINEIKNIMPPQTREWTNLISQAQEGNRFAVERLVLMYLRTVLKHAYDFARTYYCDFENAFQDGVMGLMTAIKKYDITSPDSFVTYFPLWVRQNMRRNGEIRGTIFRLPMRYKENIYNIVSKATRNMEEDDLVSGFLCLDDIEVKEMNHIYPHLEVNLDICSKYDVENFVVKKLLRDDLLRNIKNLKDREQQVIIMRYGVVDGVEHTLEEIGNMLNITRERVRQIEAKALEKLRKQNLKLFNI